VVYVRTKNIYGSEYAYLVESIKTKKGNRQKVKQYLGKVHVLDKKETSIPETIYAKKKKNFLLSLIIPELEAMGFKRNRCNYIHKNLVFDPKKLSLQKHTKSKTIKEAVIKTNDAYLSTFTLQRILKFKKSDDLNKDAQELAKYFLEAGLSVSQDHFIAYYQLI